MQTRPSERQSRVMLACLSLLLCGVCHATAAFSQAADTASAPKRLSPARLPPQIDVSPLPNYKGDFVSLGLSGEWRKPDGRKPFVGAQTLASQEPAADCSRQAIIHFASQAPYLFEKDKQGLLYGVETHTPETRISGMPGFNSCALVVHAILKKAGCDWAKYSANAKAVYDMAAGRGWRPTDRQEPGCLVAWNSKWKGKRERIGQQRRGGGKAGTLFRHLGITTGSWISVDNTSFLSRPTPFLTWRPIRYDPPFFLCPAEPSAAKKAK